MYLQDTSSARKRSSQSRSLRDSLTRTLAAVIHPCLEGPKNDASDPERSLVSVSSCVLDEQRCVAGECLIRTEVRAEAFMACLSTPPASYGIRTESPCQRPADKPVPGSSCASSDRVVHTPWRASATQWRPVLGRTAHCGLAGSRCSGSARRRLSEDRNPTCLPPEGDRRFASDEPLQARTRQRTVLPSKHLEGTGRSVRNPAMHA